MNRRPVSITILGLLFIAVGSFGLVADVWSRVRDMSVVHNGIMGHHSLLEFSLEVGTHLLALIAGVFVMQGKNWARWLCVAWMAFHVVISVGHAVDQLIVHCVLLVMIVLVLFRPTASAYFRNS